MAQELVAAVFSDGWTAVDHHPIVNVIMGVRSLHTLRASIDTMGQEKTMEFIDDLILQHIKEIGEGRDLHGWGLQGCFRVDPEGVSLGVVFCVTDPRYR